MECINVFFLVSYSSFNSFQHKYLPIFTLYEKVPKRVLLSKVGWYSIRNFWDIYITPTMGRGHVRFLKKIKPQILLPTAISSCQITFWYLIHGLDIALYRFSFDGILSAWHWSDYAYLQKCPSYSANEHVYPVSLRNINFYWSYRLLGPTDGQTNGQGVTQNSTKWRKSNNNHSQLL